MKIILLAVTALFSTFASAHAETVLLNCDHGALKVVQDPEMGGRVQLVLSRRLSREVYDASLLNTTTVDNQQRSHVVARGLPRTATLLNDDLQSRQIVFTSLIKQTITGLYSSGQGGVTFRTVGAGGSLRVDNLKVFDSKSYAVWNVYNAEFKDCQR